MLTSDIALDGDSTVRATNRMSQQENLHSKAPEQALSRGRFEELHEELQ